MLPTIVVEDIHDFSQGFFNSQQNEIIDKDSNCEELKEVDFDDGPYCYVEINSFLKTLMVTSSVI